MITFGAGKLIAVPTTDYAGNAIAVPTPVAVAVLQDVTVDIDYETKTLHGEKQFAVAVARGKGKIGWKAKTGDFDSGVLGSLLLGQTPTAARKSAVVDSPYSVPAASPYTISIAPPDTGVFVADLGVTNVITGKPMIRVASAPATGQYSLTSAGVYTFAAADTGAALLISYEYSIAINAASKLFSINNPLMGYTPTFSALFYNEYMGKKLVMKLNACVMGKNGLPFKNTDFTMIDMDAEAFADASGQVGYICQY